MAQKSMPFDEIKRIIDQYPRGIVVNLQGEGEPTQHPDFEAIVRYVYDSGKLPFIITNGSRINASFIRKCFKSIGFSIDTLDDVESNKIGRFGLKYVLSALDSVKDIATVYTVDYGQNIEPLRQYLKAKAIPHIIQKANTKSDYPIHKEIQEYHYNCQYINNRQLDYYNINSKLMPCCYIKDESKCISIDDIKEKLKNRQVPDCCVGCRQISH